MILSLSPNFNKRNPPAFFNCCIVPSAKLIPLLYKELFKIGNRQDVDLRFFSITSKQGDKLFNPSIFFSSKAIRREKLAVSLRMSSTNERIYSMPFARSETPSRMVSAIKPIKTAKNIIKPSRKYSFQGLGA